MKFSRIIFFMFFSVFFNDSCSSVVSTSSVKNVARMLAHIGGSGVILSNSECLPKALTQKAWGKEKKQDDFISSAFKLLGWNILVFFALGSEERLCQVTKFCSVTQKATSVRK